MLCSPCFSCSAYSGSGRIILLKRTDIDTSVKDMEGYTAFDLYNSTVPSANPTSLQDGCADLLTWGANRCVLARTDMILRLNRISGILSRS